MAAELMIGFWFGVGVILAFGVVDSLIIALGCLPAVAANELATTKMEGPAQVLTKDPKKVEA